MTDLCCACVIHHTHLTSNSQTLALVPAEMRVEVAVLLTPNKCVCVCVIQHSWQNNSCIALWHLPPSFSITTAWSFPVLHSLSFPLFPHWIYHSSLFLPHPASANTSMSVQRVASIYTAVLKNGGSLQQLCFSWNSSIIWANGRGDTNMLSM